MNTDYSGRPVIKAIEIVAQGQNVSQVVVGDLTFYVLMPYFIGMLNNFEHIHLYYRQLLDSKILF
jgi:hypothetical protein